MKSRRPPTVSTPGYGFALALALLATAGCGPGDVEGTYGKRQPVGGQGSVNGTGVLADMFEERGHDVSSWQRFSPRLKEADVIVWLPDNYSPPSQAEKEWLEEWLASSEGENRVLVYVGRDYDAEVVYWQRMIDDPNVPPEQVEEMQRRLAIVRSERDTERGAAGGGPRRRVRRLSGPWIDDLRGDGAAVDFSKIEIDQAAAAPLPVGGTPQKEPLLRSGDGSPLVTRLSDPAWGSGYSRGEVIQVENGSFLLNLPLTNREHRKLAGKLVEECESGSYANKKVVFLETGLDVLILEEEPTYPRGDEMLREFPLGPLLMHVLVLGILLCFVFMPIFGRARRLPPSGRSDFGKHIAALGELMKKTGNINYARGRVENYQQNVRRESGASHRDSRQAAGGRGIPPLSAGAAPPPPEKKPV